MGLFDFLFGEKKGRATVAENGSGDQIASRPKALELSRDEAIEESLSHLRAHAIANAARVVREYESRQSRPRGVGVNWAASGDRENVRMVEIIFQVRPRILRELPDCNWEPLRVAAAMDYLWGTNRAKRWLPSDFPGCGVMGADASARMLIFRAQTLSNLQHHQEIGITRWRILGCNTSCPACRGIAGKKYTFDQLPELPHPECTHEMGCRCHPLPEFDD